MQEQSNFSIAHLCIICLLLVKFLSIFNNYAQEVLLLFSYGITFIYIFLNLSYKSSFKSFSLIQPILRKNRPNAQVKTPGKMKHTNSIPIQSIGVMAALVPDAISLIQPV